MEIVLFSAELFTEIGLSTEMGLSWRSGKISWKMCLMYSEGFDQVDESTTRAVTKEMAARREIRYLGLHQRVSGICARERMRIRRLLLCCGVFLAVFEDEADDELEAVAILVLAMVCSMREEW